MTNGEFKELAGNFAKCDPETWSLIYPRYIETPPGYMPLRNVACMLLANVIAFAQAKAAGVKEAVGVQVTFNLASWHAKHRMPTYYIAPELLDDLLESDLPDNLSWRDIPLPMPCATFMLPLGRIKHPLEGDIGFLSYAYFRAGDQFQTPFLGKGMECAWDTFSTVTSTLQSDEMPTYHMVQNADAPWVSRRQIQAHPFPDQSQWGGAWVLRTDDEDRAVQELMVSLTWRIIMAMNAVPELLSKGSNTGKRMSRDTKSENAGREIWTPNIIGRNYRSVRHTSTGTGTSPRMHWRRGHLRMQPYGPKLSQTKTIWIKPQLINAEIA